MSEDTQTKPTEPERPQLPPFTYRCEHSEAALALAQVWREFGFFSRVTAGMGRPHPLWYDVHVEGEPPMFEELSRFFIAGRISLAMTAN
jgi:hypothetical protein